MCLPSKIFLDKVPFAAICYILWLKCVKTLKGLLFWSFVFTFKSTISSVFVVGICTICVGSTVIVESAILGEVSFLGVYSKVSIAVDSRSVSSVSLRVNSVQVTCSTEVSTLIVLPCFSIVLS